MDKSKQFILSVSCANDWLDGFDYFVIEIDPEYARLLLGRIELLRSILKRDKDACELYFWDYSGGYFDGDPDEHDVSRQPSRAECNQLVVRENDLSWMAIPKHTDLYATTDYIRADQLAEISASPR